MDEPNATVRPDTGEKDKGIDIGSKDKSVGWYDQMFHGIEPAARKLLEEYSHIPPEEVDQYVIAMVRYTEALFLLSPSPQRTHTKRHRDN